MHFLDSNSSDVNLQPCLGVVTWVSRVVFLGLWRQPTTRVGSAEWWQLLWKGYELTQQRLTQVVAVAQMTWQHSALPDPASLIPYYSNTQGPRPRDCRLFINMKWFSLSDGFWWIRVDDRGEKRHVKSIWKHLTHATFKQYIPPIYNLLLVTGLMSWRQTATRLAQRQSAQRILADVTTGRGSWLGGWVGSWS